MSWTSDLMGGLATYLDAQTAATYRSSGVYTAGETAIVFDTVPASPDRLIVLTPYSTTDHPTLTDTEVSVQVRVRGTKDPRTAYELDDAVFEALQNLPRTVMGTVTVLAVWRQNSAYLGVDANGRHERVSNYRLLTNRAAAHRED